MSPKWDYIAKIVSLGDSGCGKSSLTIRLCEGRFVNQHDVTIGVEFGSRIVPVGPPASKALAINDPSVPAASITTSSPAATSTTTSTTSSNKKPQHQQQQQQQQHMKLSLWDTAGQETYKSVTRSYFRGASGALLVFDITRRATFHSATAWLNDLRQIAEEGTVVVLVGNKSDLAPDSTVSSATSPLGNKDQENKRQVTVDEAEEWCRQNDVMRYVETSAKSGDGVERAFLEVAERIFQNIQAGKYDLNDRRSGVKSAAASSSAAQTARTVNLGVDDNEVGGGGAGTGTAGRQCC